MGGPQFQLEGAGGPQYAAELRILLVYLSESLGRLGQNGGHWGAHFSLGGRGPPAPPHRTAPVTLIHVNFQKGRQY